MLNLQERQVDIELILNPDHIPAIMNYLLREANNKWTL